MKEGGSLFPLVSLSMQLNDVLPFLAAAAGLVFSFLGSSIKIKLQMNKRLEITSYIDASSLFVGLYLS